MVKVAVVTGMDALRAELRAPELRSALERYVRRRVPATEVDDIVQTVLCQAWASAPGTAYTELRRWVIGIARHKVADLYRDAAVSARVSQRVAEVAPRFHDGGVGAEEWARWAEAHVGDDVVAERTLRWMARESEGEKLAHIAAEEQVPHEVVRQRVSRLRRRMRSWYAAELAALVLVAGVLWWSHAPEAFPRALVVAEEPNPLAVEAQRVAAAWRERGYTTEIMADPPGRAWNDVVHDHDEILLVLEGELELRVGDTLRRVPPGVEVMVPGGQVHSVRVAGARGARWLYGYAVR